jgi:trimethylamine--corrinoid protein Co-methyltransferase
VLHAAGWIGGGLAASFEKLILDAEMLQMMAAYYEGFSVEAADLALDAIREVGPGGHFFAAAHTLERYTTAFYTPILSNWDNYENWMERGRVDARTRAEQIWRTLLDNYVAPSLDDAIVAELTEFVERRHREGGAGAG